MVTGASGAVGATAVQLAARAGAEVVGVVGRPAKLPHVPDAAKAVLAADLSEESVGGKVDVLIDTVGGTILRNALALVRPRGRAALVGYTAGRELTLDLADFFLADVSLLPVNMISRGKEVAAEVVRLLPDLSSGELTLPYERLRHRPPRRRGGAAAQGRGRSAKWCSTWADPAGRRGG